MSLSTIIRNNARANTRERRVETPLEVHELPLFRVLPEAGRALVLEKCRPQKFPPRTVVFHQGEAGDHLYMVRAGRALVHATTEDGEAVTFAVVGPGQTFGELSLVDTYQRRTGTVIALSELDTLALHRDDFLALRDRFPGIDRLLVEALAAQVERLSRHLLESLYVPVEQRVARRLIAVAGAFGGLEPGTTVPITQEDLAGLAGTTRPTANLVLRALEEEGAVRLGRGRIEIVDPMLIRRRGRPATA
jgi:CRP/FNR family cyclic AMP-dependent transcriptional regulator